MKVKVGNTKPLVNDILRAGLVPNLLGSPGIAKSAILHQIADENKLKLIDIRLSQMDPVEMSGFPKLDGDKATYVPVDLFPIEGDKIPEGYAGWLVLLDEMNSAAPAVIAAAYKIILDRMVGQHKLHSSVYMVAAGNLTTDKAIVSHTGTAMQSRMVHLELEVDPDAWINWADNNGIDHRIKSFIQFKPDGLHKFDPNHTEHTFASPRTWEFLSKLIINMKEIGYEKLPLLSGTIGEGMAREFHAFSEIYGDIPTIEQIIRNPSETEIATEPSVQYALAGMVSSYMDKSNARPLMTFLGRMAIDFQVIALRAALAKDINLKNEAAIREWIASNSRELAQHG